MIVVGVGASKRPTAPPVLVTSASEWESDDRTKWNLPDVDVKLGWNTDGTLGITGRVLHPTMKSFQPIMQDDLDPENVLGPDCRDPNFENYVDPRRRKRTAPESYPDSCRDLPDLTSARSAMHEREEDVMKCVWMTLCWAGLVGCVGTEAYDGDGPQGEASSAVTRPPLSSICSSTCRNSHFQRVCFDQRDTGAVNISVIPLLEGTSSVPSPEIGTTTGWSSTSCPNCQWHLVSVNNDGGGTVTSGVTVATAAVNVKRSSGGDWNGTVNIQISDPTDASVGVCNLHVGIELINGSFN